MSTHTNTVADRFAAAGAQLDPLTALTAAALVAALGFALLFMQEPLAHEALHDFRHGAGITCH
ncbi:CbtB-domain containing protein [Halorubrum rutilum]|uniref:CbtB-domain containing protein n=1 Tax=Halorubrum rutilum TaxID=1364933 RepID=A0ABD6AHT5_9EURY|nr:CbtB-domain containing protein [Halorubrum rutilum]